MAPERRYYQRLINWLIAGIWLVNGLICKLLNLVPRHRQIVAAVTGSDHAGLLTGLIGAGEILVFLWIISGYRNKLCAAFQIFILLLMNIIEFIKVPQLLLFGRLNLLFAVLLAAVIYLNNFRQMKTN